MSQEDPQADLTHLLNQALAGDDASKERMYSLRSVMPALNDELGAPAGMSTVTL